MHTLCRSFFLITILLLAAATAISQPLYFPPLSGAAWDTVSPSSLGWHADRIDTLLSFLDSNRTKAFLVLKDGRIAIEHYFGTFTADSLWYWASAGKSMTAFLVGMAQQDGILSINDSTSHYIGTGWTSCPPGKEGLITIRHQLTMTTGLKDLVPDQSDTSPASLIYEADAGTRWAYHTAPYTLLDQVTEAASGQAYNLYFAAKIRSRTGMGGLWVPSGYNNVYVSNARSMARFGLLVLNKGIWDTDTLLADTAYFRDMTNSSQSLNPSYGYLWWLNGKASYMVPLLQTVFPGSWAPDAPAEMIAALGKNGQFINIIPTQRLVMVRMGEAPDTSYDVPMQFDNDIWIRLNAVIGSPDAVKDRAYAPARSGLDQNYPNPFNPETEIRYQVSAAGRVRLIVYDVLGREVRTLVDEVKRSGAYSVRFNGRTLPSGVYFCRLQSGSFVETKKLVLLR